LKFVDKIDLTGAKIRDDGLRGEATQFFKLRLACGEHLHLTADSIEEKQIWMNDVNDILTELSERETIAEEQAQKSAEQKAGLIKQKLGLDYYHSQTDKK